MKLSTLPFFNLVFLTSVFPQRVEIHQLHSKIFNNTRGIRVYLPPVYSNSGKRYPVLYMNDGIATFNAYNLASVTDSLINNKIIEPIIIVGVDNGGSVEGSKNPVRDRANEYLPWPDLSETDAQYKIERPRGYKYPSFLFNEVMPLINKTYRTKTGRSNTGLGGASYSALAALYTAIHQPGKIGFLLLESPSLYVYNQQILKEAGKTPAFPKTYIGIGTKEGATEAIQSMALNDSMVLDKLLTVKYGNKKIWLKIDTGASHDFDFFAKRFPSALKFLYGKKRHTKTEYGKKLFKKRLS
jgi:predicted alpha/beta superfamily hydrolase